MYPDPHSNPMLPFTATTEIPFYWQQYLLANAESTLYTAPACRLLIQEIYVGTHVLWYLVFNISRDDLLIKLVLPPGLFQLLLYNVQNNGEIMFLHEDLGLGISEKDYCYLSGGFTDRDLRVLISKGTYQTVMFPFSRQHQRSTITGMKSDETFAFIERSLMAIGIPLIN
ncbi:hypothetical protein GO495_09305 [Chitinophaga oryziterrae]|uniref:Uncharacterized protein n=1 Tax=Chitinophaga oryziterrae TaxID=1031224 RepID=A0A6N8J6W2_9BACT|nr:hypothetical protein [Chitinophaga oryziterrae]MVT40773.1 hypothetical protein [Chitinophaga oryziterrae]